MHSDGRITQIYNFKFAVRTSVYSATAIVVTPGHLCLPAFRADSLSVNGGEVDVFSGRYKNPDWALQKDFVVEELTRLLLSHQWPEGMAVQALWCSRTDLSCIDLCSCVLASWLLTLHSPTLHFYFAYWLKALILHLVSGFCIFQFPVFLWIVYIHFCLPDFSVSLLECNLGHARE